MSPMIMNQTALQVSSQCDSDLACFSFMLFDVFLVDSLVRITAWRCAMSSSNDERLWFPNSTPFVEFHVKLAAWWKLKHKPIVGRQSVFFFSSSVAPIYFFVWVRLAETDGNTRRRSRRYCECLLLIETPQFFFFHELICRVGNPRTGTRGGGEHFACVFSEFSCWSNVIERKRGILLILKMTSKSFLHQAFREILKLRFLKYLKSFEQRNRGWIDPLPPIFGVYIGCVVHFAFRFASVDSGNHAHYHSISEHPHVDSSSDHFRRSFGSFHDQASPYRHFSNVDESRLTMRAHESPFRSDSSVDETLFLLHDDDPEPEKVLYVASWMNAWSL